MSYSISKTTNLPYEEAVERTVEELKKDGFGVLTEIDVRATLKKKLDVDFPRYIILGACNPPFAHRALSAETEIGLLLPCNVIVHELKDGSVSIAAMDPAVVMNFVENDEIKKVAAEVREILVRVLDRIG